MIIGGTLVIALLVPFFMGWHLWFVPLVVLPFAALYLVADRRLAQEEEEGGGH